MLSLSRTIPTGRPIPTRIAQVGMVGEKLRIYNQHGSHRVQWSAAKKGTPLTWYKVSKMRQPGTISLAGDQI